MEAQEFEWPATALEASPLWRCELIHPCRKQDPPAKRKFALFIIIGDEHAQTLEEPLQCRCDCRRGPGPA